MSRAARQLARHKEKRMPAIPQPMPVPPPKQVTYPNVVIDVQPLPEGNVMLVVQAPAGAPTEVLLFPMSGEYAIELDRKLTAPHVIPAANGHGPHPPMPGPPMPGEPHR